MTSAVESARRTSGWHFRNIGYVLAGSALLAAAPAPAQQKLPELHLDSFRAYLTETGHIFHCGEAQLRLRVAERLRKGEEALPLADRWRLALIELDVPGRVIAGADPSKVAALFQSLSWIRDIESRCSGDGAIWVSFSGMPAQAWADFAEKKGPPERPQTVPYQVAVSATGEITIR